MTLTPTLAVTELSVRYPHSPADIAAVRDVSLCIAQRECVGIVGESGSGKTQMFMAAMGLLPDSARVTGSVRFDGRELLGLTRRDFNRVRGSKLSMIFQDPMTSLTPHLTIGVQMAEVLVVHAHLSWQDAEVAALQMLRKVQVPEAALRLRQYPHELSGGMRQRVMIGMSLLCEPALLIADEPTTALDMTVQAQIIELLREMRHEFGMAIALISHDLGVVAGLADRIIVMYAGRVVETGTTVEMLREAGHPYTVELLKCVPDLQGPRLLRMATLAGQAPDPKQTEHGCAFAPRCPTVRTRCWQERPLLRGIHPSGHELACHFPRI